MLPLLPGVTLHLFLLPVSCLNSLVFLFICPLVCVVVQVVCASTSDKSKVEILEPPAGAKPGERITFAGACTHKAFPSTARCLLALLLLFKCVWLLSLPHPVQGMRESPRPPMSWRRRKSWRVCFRYVGCCAALPMSFHVTCCLFSRHTSYVGACVWWRMFTLPRAENDHGCRLGGCLRGHSLHDLGWPMPGQDTGGRPHRLTSMACSIHP